MTDSPKPPDEDSDDQGDDLIPEEIDAELDEIPEELRLKVLSIIRSYSGPLPLPSHLAGYEKLKPGAADRILQMAEAQSAHRREIESKLVDADIEDRKAERAERRLGQWLGFSIGAVTVLSGAVVAAIGQPWAGGFIGGTGVIGLVSIFVIGRSIEARRAEQESDEDD